MTPADKYGRAKPDKNERGCARCPYRESNVCNHPSVHDDTHSLAEYVRNDLRPGAPLIMPQWCPMLQVEKKPAYVPALTVMAMDPFLKTVVVRVEPGWKLVQYAAGEGPVDV